MTRRVTRSMTARLRIFQEHRGICDICGDLIDGVRQPWELDHVIPLALGGEDTDENLRPVHAACHRGAGSKTSDDVARISKAKRVHAKHVGAWKPKSSLPGSKGSKWKRKLDGTTVPRED